MAEKQRFYDVNRYCNRLEPGDRLKIEHSVRYDGDGTHQARLTHMTADKLGELREASVAQEKVIFAKLVDAVKEWEEQGANTMLLDKAIEYVQTPPVKHTSNEWEAGEYGGFECSNMVYKMTYQIREDTQFNPKTRRHDIPSWLVSWSLSYNFPDHARGGGAIAGQEKKKYTSKEKLDNYVIGRIAAHAGYFTELSPPVPKNLAWKFSRNGQLLPGYTVEGQAPPAPAKEAPVKVSETPGTDYSKFIRKSPQRGDGKKKTAPVR